MSILKQTKIPGILGGMGPEATVDFMAKVISKTHARVDQDHIRMIVDHNPKVPNRHAAINGQGEDVGPYLAQMAKSLELYGADFIAMVCNTAHAFQEEIEQAVTIPFVSIIEEVVGELKRQWPDKIKVGIMAADGCLQSGLYQDALGAAGYEAILWDVDQLDQFMALLYRIKAGEQTDEVRSGVNSLASYLVKGGAQVIISGCTEIPLVIDEKALSVPLLNSTDILVTRVIGYSLGQISPN